MIRKYKLEITDEQVLHLPLDAQILTAQQQREELMIWALVNPKEKETEERTLAVVGTGNPFPNCDDCEYIATVQTGQFVWHVFEVIHE